jgi:hypothetical protein
MINSFGVGLFLNPIMNFLPGVRLPTFWRTIFEIKTPGPLPTGIRNSMPKLLNDADWLKPGLFLFKDRKKIDNPEQLR